VFLRLGFTSFSQTDLLAAAAAAARLFVAQAFYDKA
jgi:hypothetical protein